MLPPEGGASLWTAILCRVLFFFFFQAEDGIRDLTVTGVQTCALPICSTWTSPSCTPTCPRTRGSARWWRSGRAWPSPWAYWRSPPLPSPASCITSASAATRSMTRKKRKPSTRRRRSKRSSGHEVRTAPATDHPLPRADPHQPLDRGDLLRTDGLVRAGIVPPCPVSADPAVRRRTVDAHPASVHRPGDGGGLCAAGVPHVARQPAERRRWQVDARHARCTAQRRRAAATGGPLQCRPETAVLGHHRLPVGAVADRLRDLAAVLQSFLPDRGDPVLGACPCAVRLGADLRDRGAHLCGDLDQGVGAGDDAGQGDLRVGVQAPPAVVPGHPARAAGTGLAAGPAALHPLQANATA